MLIVQDVTYRIGGRILLDNIRFQLPDGQRAGLVGRNGCGKSSLFRLILGQSQVDSGSIEISKGQKIITVAQEVPGGSQTPLEFLLASDKERFELLEKAETCENPHELADVYDRLIQIDAYTAEARASTVLKGLGFSDEQQNTALSSFSGGYRMRVALAAALFQKPDLLMLDEPTNHLDLEATLWLKEFLKSYPNSLLIISHDRELMNECVDNIFHLQQGKVTRYTGNYDFYIKTYYEQKAFAEAYNAKVAAQKDHMMKFVTRFGAKASKAVQAQSKLKAIAKLVPINLAIEDPTIKLDFPETEKLSPPLIHYEKISLGYDDKVVLKNLSGNIAPEDRIALLGANGNGKSTFAKFLAKRLKPQSGISTFHPKLRVAYFHQHQLEDLHGDETAYQHMQQAIPNANETQIRAQLGRFGFQRDKANVIAKNLSGGEKARLVFALMTIHKPHIIILDEPTNHLDMEMRESLMMSINNFEGAVILIAHDWHLLSHTADRLWLVANNTIKPYEGSLEDYRDEVLGKAVKKESKPIKKENKTKRG